MTPKSRATDDYPSRVIFNYHVAVSIVGQRLRSARALRGVSQRQLAARLGTTREAVSMVEHGHSRFSVDKLGAAARSLDVSTDYLHGLIDDPTPVARLLCALADATGARHPDDRDARAGPADDGDYVGVSELASAAGAGAVVYDERVTGRIKFRRAWLARHGLSARDCRVIQVIGESMEPTLADGCSILVNHARRQRRVGHIYVVRTGDGLVVKRAGRDVSGAWLLVSDNPNKLAWPNRPWPAEAQIVGEVRWAARTFL